MNTHQIEYKAGLFEPFKREDDPEGWTRLGFPELMQGLGFEMDCEKSYREFVQSCGLMLRDAKNEHDEKRGHLYILEHAPRQVVGNYLFSRYRYLTHWNEGPISRFEPDYLHRIIAILEKRFENE